MAKIQTKQFLGTRAVPTPDSTRVVEVPVVIVMPTTQPAVNDLVQLLPLPAGIRCLDWSIVSPKIDSSGSPSVAASLGIENTAGTDLGAEVWASGLTFGQAGVAARCANAVSATGDVSVDRIVSLKWTAAFAGYAAIAGQRVHVLLKLHG